MSPVFVGLLSLPCLIAIAVGALVRRHRGSCKGFLAGLGTFVLLACLSFCSLVSRSARLSLVLLACLSFCSLVSRSARLSLSSGAF